MFGKPGSLNNFGASSAFACFLAILSMQILDKIAVVTLGIRGTDSTASTRGRARVETRRERAGGVKMANTNEILHRPSWSFVVCRRPSFVFVGCSSSSVVVVFVMVVVVHRSCRLLWSSSHCGGRGRGGHVVVIVVVGCLAESGRQFAMTWGIGCSVLSCYC